MVRRTLLKFWTAALGALAGALVGIPGIAYIIDPRKRFAPPPGFRPVAKLSELPRPKDGRPVPVQVVISDTRRDAWTIHPEEVIGRVWLLRQADDSVKAFTSICPHLGCSINFESGSSRFVCPCHGGVFELSGRKLDDAELDGRKNPPPRDMDALQVRLVRTASGEDALVEVMYAQYKPGEKDSILKA